MIEHFERQPVFRPVFLIPPVTDSWFARLRGLFRPAYPVRIQFIEAGEIITKLEGTDD